jgi:hypothetical protein
MIIVFMFERKVIQKVAQNTLFLIKSLPFSYSFADCVLVLRQAQQRKGIDIRNAGKMCR